MKTLAKYFIVLLMFSSSFIGSAMAENMKKLGTFNVHYIAIGATFITPEIAKTYNIERSLPIAIATA